MSGGRLRIGRMTLGKHAGVIALALVLLPACASSGGSPFAAAQIEALRDTGEDSVVESTGSDASYFHVPIGLDSSGISIGNSRRWNGLRFNFSDNGVEEVNGLNIGVWDLHKPSIGRMTGIDVGLSNRVTEGRGLSLAAFGTEGEDSLRGIYAAGLATVSGSDIHGLGLGGLAVVAGAGLDGIHAGGLAVVSGADQRGLGLGGLALVSGGAQSGIRAGGLAVVSGAGQSGLSLAGLACVSGADLSGIALSGLATVVGGHVDGLAGALAATRTRGLNGVALSAYNRVDGRQTGLSVGLFNRAHSLQGVQIGLLNYVRENPAWLRWLPIVNARF